MTASEPLLRVEGIRKAFAMRRGLADVIHRKPGARLVALDGVSVSVAAQRTLGIVGESGSGKSTLAKTIVRLVEPDAGVVTFRGVDILKADARELREARRRVQLVYQDPYSSLNPRLRIGDAIIEPARVHGLTRHEDEKARRLALMEQVGLSPTLADRRPRALSGGQRQRVAIARALATEPDVLIADEAVSALDVSIQAQILNLFSQLQRDLGLAIVFISHQLSVIAHVADDVAVMYLGRIVEQGPVAEVFSKPAHPYTALLLAAQPGRHRRAHRQPALQGEIPSPLNIPRGCRFRTRCPLAQPVCSEIDPPRVDVDSTHASWCHVLPARLDRGDQTAAKSGTAPSARQIVTADRVHPQT